MNENRVNATLYTCKICGWSNLRYQHQGAVDCIAAYRAYVEELQNLLPHGKQIILASIDRESTVRIWIEGPITYFGLERVKQYVDFMQEAYDMDRDPRCDRLKEKPAVDTADSTENNSPPSG